MYIPVMYTVHPLCIIHKYSIHPYIVLYLLFIMLIIMLIELVTDRHIDLKDGTLVL